MGANYFQNMLRVCKSVYNTKAIERTSQHDRTTSQTDSMAAQSENKIFFEMVPMEDTISTLRHLDPSKNVFFEIHCNKRLAPENGCKVFLEHVTSM